MGKRQVHTVAVRKPVTIALLLLTTAAMAALIYFLSGKAYAADAHPFRELLARLLSSHRPLSRHAALAFLMPVIANVLLFVPWGFFAFLALDAPSRSRKWTYAITFLAALVFAAMIYLWQQSLPTLVTSLNDTLSNAFGALAGAALGHARKSVRVRFAI
ncbi:MAG TPA: VanZ family protein [Thermoanaerobaculia bacterium]|nr:VanZ family protein [Thermoanaerobaculia bacterium]